MMEYFEKFKDMLENFVRYIITQISREKNSKTDALARLASTYDTSLTKLIPMEFLRRPSIDKEENG